MYFQIEKIANAWLLTAATKANRKQLSYPTFGQAVREMKRLHSVHRTNRRKPGRKPNAS